MAVLERQEALRQHWLFRPCAGQAMCWGQTLDREEDRDLFGGHCFCPHCPSLYSVTATLPRVTRCVAGGDGRSKSSRPRRHTLLSTSGPVCFPTFGSGLALWLSLANSIWPKGQWGPLTTDLKWLQPADSGRPGRHLHG